MTLKEKQDAYISLNQENIQEALGMVSDLKSLIEFRDAIDSIIRKCDDKAYITQTLIDCDVIDEHDNRIT